MTCPNCNSNHTMSTTTQELITVRWMRRGSQYAMTEKEERKTVTHRCLDCGHEWEE